MKKWIAWLLAAVMVLSMAACGKQQDPETQPDKAVSSTEAATKATTETTTEAATEAPSITEEEAFNAFVGHIKALAKALKDRDAKDAKSLSLKGNLNFDAALTVAQGDEKQEFPVSISGKGTAGLNTAQGAEAEAVYKADLSVLAGMFGGEPEEAEEKTAHYYLDFAEEKAYHLKDDGETWVWSELSMDMDDAEEDLDKLDELTPDKLFGEHSFKAEGGKYVFEGKIAMDKLAEDETDIADELEKYGLTPENLTPQLKLVLDEDCHLESVTLSVEPFSLDVPVDEASLNINLKALTLEIEADHGEVKVEIPAEVKEKAVEMDDEPDPYDEPTQAVTDLGNEVVVDNEFLKVTAVSAEIDIFEDYCVTLIAENKTGKVLKLRSDGADVNGYFTDFFIYEDLEPGETKELEASLSAEDLALIGLKEPDELLIRLEAVDENYDTVTSESFVLYPTGKDKDSIISPDRMTAEDEIPLAENDKCTMILIGAKHNDDWGVTDIICYAENKTDKTLEFSFRDSLVNGKDIYVDIWEEMPAGTKGYISCYISPEQLKEEGIDEIKTIEFTLEIRSAEEDDWAEAPLAEKEFTWEW